MMNEAVCLSLSESLHLLVKVARALIIGEHNLCLYTLYLKLIKCILLANQRRNNVSCLCGTALKSSQLTVYLACIMPAPENREHCERCEH